MSKKQQQVDGSKSPDDTIFFQLFMASQKSFYAYILASVHNFDDANDILQETATIMWRRFEEFDQDTNFTAWGIAIAKNMVRNYFRERKHSRLQFDDDLIHTIQEKTVKEIESGSERLEALKKCFQKLTNTNRHLLKLRYEEGMTIKEIATKLGRPLQGMYKYISRLQNSLSICIEKKMAIDENLA